MMIMKTNSTKTTNTNTGDLLKSRKATKTDTGGSTKEPLSFPKDTAYGSTHTDGVVELCSKHRPMGTAYGSTHTHFESDKDTANGDFKQMLLSCAALGMKKVVVTDHGTFSAYEDVLDTLSLLQEKLPDDKALQKLELVPGVECYFSAESKEESSHLVLFAKDWEGYQSLCHIITQSNKDFRKNKSEGGKPIVTLQNLKDNVRKGHIIATSACINGVFGSRFGLQRMNLEEKIQKQVAKCQTETSKLDTGLLFSSEELKSPAMKPLLNLNYAEKTGVQLVKDLLKRKCDSTADQLLFRFDATKANWAILETLRKEKQPKATADGQVNPLAMDYFLQRKAFYEERKEGYEQKKPKAIYFQTLRKLLEELKELPSEKQSNRDCISLYNQFLSIFGKDNFYFELQNHGLPTEAILYPKLVEFAKGRKNTTHFIAANDVHIGLSKPYVEARGLRFKEKLDEEVQKRDVIRFTRFNKFFQDDDTISPDNWEYYLKSDEELRECLQQIIPEEEILNNALANIEKVLSACHVEHPKGENHYPAFQQGDNDALFEQKVKEGVLSHFPNGFPEETVCSDGRILTRQDYEERLEYEMDIIKRMGYASYHLIVADYLQFGRKLGNLPDSLIQSEDCPLTMEELDATIAEHAIQPTSYSIGPGRGSAAGSLCCYSLGITDIDPMPLGLLFERYLNPERISMPDIDVDFKVDIRSKCMEYCKRKYGHDNVCSISTKSYAGAKNALRIAARYLGAKAWLCNPLKKELEAQYQAGEIRKKDLDEAENQSMKSFYQAADDLCKACDTFEPQDKFFTAYKDADSGQKKILQLASLLEGCFTGYGQHAAGVIISKDAITDSIPLMYCEGKENMETQCNMAQAEAKGFLKMDFLGLENLSIITNIMRSCGDYKLLDPQFRAQMLKDSRIFKEIYCTGRTQGVFQMESPGMKSFLQQLQPDCFEDIILLNAAYRPGPMQFLPEIIEEKRYQRGERQDRPEHSLNMDCEALREILKPTYGCIIYQEQVMQICRQVAGFSMGRADNVRRYMSKKKEAKLLEERPDFVSGCMEVSHLTKAEADKLFDAMIDFAKYAFNLSHASCYALVSMFTAYLKLYHPAEFFAESLNAVAELTEILPFTMEIPSFGLRLLPPDLQKSTNRFMAVGTDIYYGLDYIKGLSGVSYQKASSFSSFLLANKEEITEKTMQKLCKCGLFDSLEPSITRKDLVDVIPALYKDMSSADKYRETEKTILSQIRLVHQALEKPRLTLEEKTELLQALNSRKAPHKVTRKDIETRLTALREKLGNTRSQLIEKEEAMERRLQFLRVTSKPTNESILLNRQWEQEFLGYIFDVKDSMAVLERCNAFPAGTLDNRTPVTEDIPNLGLIVLNPCVKRTPSGWTKVLCCDKHRTYKHLYFSEEFPKDITEFALTFHAERLQERRQKDDSTNSNNMYVAPRAYSLNEIGYTPMKNYYVESREDWLTVCGQLDVKKSFHATAHLCCAALGYLSIPCKADELEQILEKEEIAYISFEEK